MLRLGFKWAIIPVCLILFSFPAKGRMYALRGNQEAIPLDRSDGRKE
jgi:hypothetical protein